jgi:hypothetical protein
MFQTEAAYSPRIWPMKFIKAGAFSKTSTSRTHHMLDDSLTTRLDLTSIAFSKLEVRTPLCNLH